MIQAIETDEMVTLTRTQSPTNHCNGRMESGARLLAADFFIVQVEELGPREEGGFGQGPHLE